MRRLLAWLFRPREKRFWPYVVTAAALGLIGSTALSSIAWMVVTSFGYAPTSPETPISWAGFFAVALVAPVLETALLYLTVKLVLPVVRSARCTAAVSAVPWGALHASAHPMWFFGTVWSFFVFSAAIFAWRGRSPARAFAAAALVHAMINTAAFTALALLSNA
jgi:hypothetical protein